MSILKIKKRSERFAVISTNILEDKNLSWKAKGLLSYLLSRPEDWTVRIQDLIKRSTDGRDAVKSALRELREVGYAELIREQDSKGRLKGTSYLIHEIPQQPTDGKTVERKNRQTEKPSDGKPVDIVKKDYILNNNTTNKQKGLFNEQPSFPLSAFFKDLPKTFSPLALEAKGQPSEKKISEWKERFGEEYVLSEIMSFERWLQRKKQEGKFPKIKNVSQKLNNWLNNKFIQDQGEREIYDFFSAWWQSNITAPFRFDLFKGSNDRKALSSIVEYLREICAKSKETPLLEWNRILCGMDAFWKGQRLSIIARNLPKIYESLSNPKSSAGQSAGNKGCATINSFDFV